MPAFIKLELRRALTAMATLWRTVRMSNTHTVTEAIKNAQQHRQTGDEEQRERVKNTQRQGEIGRAGIELAPSS